MNQAVRRLVEEVIKASSDVAKERSRTSQEVCVTNNLINLTQQLCLVVFQKNGLQVIGREMRILEYESVKAYCGVFDISQCTNNAQPSLEWVDF